MPRKRSNAMATVAATAKRRAAERADKSANVVALPSVNKGLRNRLWFKANNDGIETLHALDKWDKIRDLGIPATQRKMATLLGAGFIAWSDGGAVNSRRSVYNAAGDLRLGIAAFLIEKYPTSQVDPAAINSAFWAGFKTFLDRPRADGNPQKQSRRRKLLGIVRKCLEALRGDPDDGDHANYLLDRTNFPFNAYPGSNRKAKPTETLPQRELVRMTAVCLGQIEEIRSWLDKRDALLAAGQAALEEFLETSFDDPAERSRRLRQDLGLCAAWIDAAFPDRLVNMADLRELDANLSYAVKRVHGMTSVRRMLYNFSLDLVPFILLIGRKTAFNPDTLLTLTWDRVQFLEEGRRNYYVIHGEKDRAATLQTERFDAEKGVTGGLDDVLTLLRRLTERSRNLVLPEHRDRLFIAAPVHCGSSVKAFGNNFGVSSDKLWKFAFDAFKKEHDLPDFTLASLRHSAPEEIRRTGGDARDVQQKLGHKNPQTTLTHYTSDGVRRMERDRIAAVQTSYVGWVESDGLYEIRGRQEWDRKSATPGFMCLDPFDSPQLGQKKDRLCTAFGRCPGCPLAVARTDDVVAAASYIALRTTIYGAQQGVVSGAAWQARWADTVKALDNLISAIPEHILREAQTLSVTLPPVA